MGANGLHGRGTRGQVAVARPPRRGAQLPGRTRPLPAATPIACWPAAIAQSLSEVGTRTRMAGSPPCGVASLLCRPFLCASLLGWPTPPPSSPTPAAAGARCLHTTKPAPPRPANWSGEGATDQGKKRVPPKAPASTAVSMV